MKKSLLYFVLFSSFMVSHGQTKMKKLVRNVSNNSENEIAPFLTMDGSKLIYTRKRAMDDNWKVQMSSFEGGTWTRPTEVKVLNELPKLRLLGGYAFNHDGTELMYTTKKYGGIGNYDIWTSKFKGGNWTKAVNLGKPVNSSDEDINPVYGLDNSKLYFIRRSAGQDNGNLYEATISNNYWQSTKKVNLGSQKFFAARFAADDQTMYLSQVNGKLTSLYVSRKSNAAWTEPRKVSEFASENKSYFGLNQRSTDLVVSAKKDITYDLYYLTLTEENQSTPVTDLSIKLDTRYVVDITKTTDPNFKIRSRDLVNHYLLNDGEYVVQILSKSYFPMVTIVDLSNAKSNQATLSPTLTPLSEGVYFLDAFLDDTETLNEKKLAQEFDAIKKTALINPDKTFELKVYQNNIETDTVRSSIYHTAIQDTTHIGDTLESISTKFSNDNRLVYLAYIEEVFQGFGLENLSLSIEQDENKFLSAAKPKGLALLVY